MSRRPGALLALLGLAMLDAPAVAGDVAGGAMARADGEGDDGLEVAPEAVHWAVGAGGFVGLTGPARYGLAAEAEVFPPWPFGDRIGLGLRYRGFDGLARGLVSGGLVYVAGATRPHLAIELHGDVGVAYGTEDNRLRLGGGVRTQLGLWGPVALALHGDVFFELDDLRLRPHIVPAVTVGLAR